MEPLWLGETNPTINARDPKSKHRAAATDSVRPVPKAWALDAGKVWDKEEARAWDTDVGKVWGPEMAGAWD